MSQFVLLLKSSEAYNANFEKMSPEEMEKAASEYYGWARQLGESGKLVGGERLQRDIRIIKPGASPTITDGPFAESKEAIGGFFQIEAKDLQEATEVAKSCPHLKFGGTIELRQTYDMPKPSASEAAAAGARG